MPDSSRGFAALFLLPVLVIALLGAGYYFAQQKITIPKKMACTLEAKICPDGSSVGRSGPNCEFVACPSSNDPIVSRSCGGDMENAQCPDGYDCYYKDPKAATVDALGVCRKLPVLNPKPETTSEEELTLEMAYRNGDFCSFKDNQIVSSKSVCEKLDVIKIQGGTIVGGSDGSPDCKWDNKLSSCVPSK
jgi:hypothetical protein